VSHCITYAMPPEARAKIVTMFPGITPANIMRLDDLVAADRLITDDGNPTQALVDWVTRVLTR